MHTINGKISAQQANITHVLTREYAIYAIIRF